MLEEELITILILKRVDYNIERRNEKWKFYTKYIMGYM